MAERTDLPALRRYGPAEPSGEPGPSPARSTRRAWNGMACGSATTAEANSPFARARIRGQPPKLHQWFQAAYPALLQQEGYQQQSACPHARLHRQDGMVCVSSGSAKPCGKASLAPFGGGVKPSRRTRPISDARRAGASSAGFGHTMKVMSLVERGGPLRSTVMDTVTSN